MIGFLNEEQVFQLRLAHKTIKDKKLADRIKAVLSLNAGFDYKEVAAILLLDEVTLRRYVQKFVEKGVNGLLEMRYVGGLSRLTSDQEMRLKRYFKTHTALTALVVVSHLAKRYGVRYSIIGATKLLHRLGFVYKKPKVVPGKADRERQEAFVKAYNQLKSNLTLNDQIYFVDSTHPSHNTKVSYGWILRGKKNDKYIKTNTGRDRLNLNGALSLHDQTRPIVLEEKTVNSEATINLLETIRRRQKNGKVYLVLDNASHHHSRVVGRWLFHHPRFKLIFLPPYSPNLNPIERLWRFFHQRVTANHYFETFAEFKNTSLDFFKNLKVYQKELSTLLTDSFQLVPQSNFQT